MSKATPKKESPKKGMVPSVGGKSKHKESVHDTSGILSIERMLQAGDMELRILGSTLTASLTPPQRKAMLERLNIESPLYEIAENRIIKKGHQ